MRLRTLRSRVTAGFILVSALAAAVVTLTAGSAANHVLERRAIVQAGDQLSRDVNHVVPDVLGAPEDGAHYTTDELEALGARLAAAASPPVLIVGPDGQTFSSPWGPSEADISTSLRRAVQGDPMGVVHERGGRGEVIVGSYLSAWDIEIYRMLDLEPLRVDLQVMWGLAGIAGTMTAVIAGALGALATRRVLLPVQRARDAAQQMATGNLETRITIDGHDELAELCEELNAMAEALAKTVSDLERSIELQRQFVADVSHELRTPLMALTAALEVLEEEGRESSPDVRQATELVLNEVGSLRRMVEDLLEMSRLDGGASSLHTRQANLEELLRAILRRRRHTDKFQLDVPIDIDVIVDPRRIDAVIGNLADNAVAHGAPPYVIRAVENAHTVVVEVADGGPGIPEQIRDHAFGRFVKGDQARVRTGGSGLGLAIARENAQLHGGDLAIRQTGPAGTVMCLSLPKGLATARAPATGT